MALCLFALWLRAPRIGEGLPFFYREDEAHHFNRLAEMVKSGSLDPLYFHKPSLHFYLRMPVFGASFLSAARTGSIQSVQEIITRDDYGVGKWSFSASHPSIVKWNRAFTVLLGLAIVVLTFCLTWMLSESAIATFLATFAVAVSPPLIAEGAVIGVDIPMAFLCLLTVWLSLRAQRNLSWRSLLLCGISAGLAVSTKYNAAPIAIVPLLLPLLRSKQTCAAPCIHPISGALLAALGVLLGFFAASPYILVHIPLFLDQVAYELWHYGVAGHIGHQAEPGWQQFLFYLHWFNGEALGPVLTACGLIGFIGLLGRGPRNITLTFLLFPWLFGALMIAQKANFTRNVLVMIPFVAISAATIFVRTVSELPISPRNRRIVLAAFFALGLGYPAWLAVNERAEIASAAESRSVVGSSLLSADYSKGHEQIAVSGQLQFPSIFFSGGPFARFNQLTRPPLELAARGFSKLVVGSAYPLPKEQQRFFELEREVPGEGEIQRIVQNPALKVLKLQESPDLTAAFTQMAATDREFQLNVTLRPENPSLKPCVDAGRSTPSAVGESYCWVQARVVFVRLTDLESSTHQLAPTDKLTIFFDAMSPWEDNKVQFFSGDWSSDIQLPPHEWRSSSIQPPLANIKSQGGFFVAVSTVRSPKLQRLSEDDRNLGLALHNISLEKRG